MQSTSTLARTLSQSEELKAVLSNYREVVSSNQANFNDHIILLRLISEIYNFASRSETNEPILKLINEAYQNGVQQDKDEYHVRLNNEKLNALILCHFSNQAYMEYTNLVEKGNEYVNFTTHALILDMLCEEHRHDLVHTKGAASHSEALLQLCEEYEGFAKIQDDYHDEHHTDSVNAINNHIAWLMLIKENEVIESRIKEVYNRILKTDDAKNPKLHLLLINWAVKAKNTEMVNFIYETAQKCGLPEKKMKKIKERYDSFIPLSLIPEELTLSHSTDSCLSEEKKFDKELSSQTLSKKDIVSFYSIFKKMMEAKQMNEGNLLNTYFQEAIATCPAQLYQDLYVSAIEAAGECFQVDLAWSIYQQACGEGFDHDISILFEMLNAASNCMHLDYLTKTYTSALIYFRDQENEMLEMKYEGLEIHQDEESSYLKNIMLFNITAIKGISRCGLAGLQKAYCIYQNLCKTVKYLDGTIYTCLITAANQNDLLYMAFEVFKHAMQLESMQKDLNLYHQMMWKAATNANRPLLEKIKKIANKNLASETELLTQIQLYYQQSCLKICDIENSQHESLDTSFSATMLAQFKGTHLNQANLYPHSRCEELHEDRISNQNPYSYTSHSIFADKISSTRTNSTTPEFDSSASEYSR